jgi:protein SCO1
MRRAELLRPASVALVWCLGGCASEPASLPYYEDADLTPVWLSPGNAAHAHRVADFTLTDQTGAPFGSEALAGRVWVAGFFFAECGDICPLTVRRLQAVADTFAQDDRVMLASFSVAPERDSAAALAHFAAMHGIEGRRWRLLTGDPLTLQRMARALLVGLGRGSAYGVDEVEHTEMVVLVDQEGRVRGVYNATLPLDVGQLIADAKMLLEQQIRAGPPVDAPGRPSYPSKLVSRLFSPS